jgi:hypothetical protein
LDKKKKFLLDFQAINQEYILVNFMEALRKVIDKSEAEIHLSIPENLQGMRIEVIILPFEEEMKPKIRRTLGLLKDHIHLSDSFFEPLPNDILEGFGSF